MARKSSVSKYLSSIGKKGGTAGTGTSKARMEHTARTAVQLRWARIERAKAELENPNIPPLMTRNMLRSRFEQLVTSSKWTVSKRGSGSRLMIVRQSRENRWFREWGVWVKYYDETARIVRVTFGVPSHNNSLAVEGEFSFCQDEFEDVVPTIFKAYDGQVAELNKRGSKTSTGSDAEKVQDYWWSQKGDKSYHEYLRSTGAFDRKRL